jgi:hypothetical protein
MWLAAERSSGSAPNVGRGANARTNKQTLLKRGENIAISLLWELVKRPVVRVWQLLVSYYPQIEPKSDTMSGRVAGRLAGSIHPQSTLRGSGGALEKMAGDYDRRVQLPLSACADGDKR